WSSASCWYPPLSGRQTGFLIGLYMAPGVVLALPGGAIGKRCGDKQVVVCALALMTCGGLIMTFPNSWQLQLFSRVTAGIGGVLLNVLMSKMIIDWFTEREHATAMVIFVNSWPLGICARTCGPATARYQRWYLLGISPYDCAGRRRDGRSSVLVPSAARTTDL